jgi:outer membrane protein TolC
MVRHAFAVVLLVVVPSGSPAAQGWPAAISVDEALALALRDNLTLRAERQEHRATQANEIPAGLRPNPVAPYAAEQLGNRNVDPPHTVTLGQPIELGGKRQRRLDSARAASRVTAAELEDVSRQVVAQVKTAERAHRETTLEHVRALGSYQAALDELETAIGYVGDR